MRLLKNRRGQIRVIEALFASLLMLSSLALIPIAQKPQNESLDGLSSMANQVVASLESNGQLSTFVDARNWTAIRSYVQSLIPLSIWFNLTVFNEDLTILNELPISSGSPVSDNIASAECVIASMNANYAVYVVRLQLAAVE
jgi:hypothetical protein